MANKLRSNITDSDTTITLEFSEGFPESGYVQIESEIIHFNYSGDIYLFECTRGTLGTTAASHAALTDVTEYDIPSPTGATFEVESGSPVDGVTGLGFLDKGSVYIDKNAGSLHVNTGTSSSPTWTTSGGGSSPILQIVAFSDEGDESTTSGTFIDTTLTADITVGAGHKVLIQVSGFLATQGDGEEAILSLKRNGTNIGGSLGSVDLYVSGARTNSNGAFFIYDSTPDTGLNTYTVQLRSANGGQVDFGGTLKRTILLTELL